MKKNRGGIVFANEYLIYILPPKDDLNLPYKIKSNELLGLFFKIKNWFEFINQFILCFSIHISNITFQSKSMWGELIWERILVE